MHRIATAVAASCLLAAGGCTTTAIESRTPNPHSGAHYYLPKGEVRIQLLRNGSSYAIRYVETNIVPDYQYGYVLTYKPSAFASDTLTVDVNASGLLDKIQFQAEEKSGDIILKVVDLAKEAAKAAFTPFGLTQEGEKYTILYDARIDPLDPTQLAELNKHIGDLTEDSSMFRVDIEPRNNGKNAERNSCKIGVCFRPQAPHSLVFRENGHVIQTVSILLPDKAQIGAVDIPRAALVTEVTNIDFDNGMLRQIHISKPSQGMAIAQVPVDAVQRIVSIPAELVQLKIDTTANNEKLLEAQLGELKARQDLIEFQRQLLEKETESASGGEPDNF